MRYVVDSAWCVFCSCFFKALGRAYTRHGFEARHVLFRADGVGLEGTGVNRKSEDSLLSSKRVEKEADNEVEGC